MALKMILSTDNWRPNWWSAEQCFKRIKELGGEDVELTTATGFNLLEGLGFSPYVSIDFDPFAMRDLVKKYGLKVVSIDADWPIWSHHSINVLNKTIVWADMLGCDTIITTDSDKYPEGRTDAGRVLCERFPQGAGRPQRRRRPLAHGRSARGGCAQKIAPCLPSSETSASPLRQRRRHSKHSSICPASGCPATGRRSASGRTARSR